MGEETPYASNVLAQARGTSELGQTGARNPALPEANGSPWKSLQPSQMPYPVDQNKSKHDDRQIAEADNL